MMQRTASLRRKKWFLTKSASERRYFWSAERRRYIRYPCAWTVRFSELTEKTSPKSFHTGKCRDVSQSGMQIAALQPVSRKAIVLIEIDPRLFSRHVKLEHILSITENRILAEVTWRHLNLDTGVFEAGLSFIEARKRGKYESLIAKASAI